MSLLKRTEGKKKSFDEVTPGVMCRDFLADVYTSVVQKYNFHIYGFGWDGTKDVPHWDAVYLKLNFPDDTAKENFKKNIKFLWKVEDDNKIPRTIFYDKINKIGMIVGNKAWLHNVLTASLYTFLIRSFCYAIKTDNWVKELGQQEHTDSEYIKSIHPETWAKILKDITTLHTPEYFCGLDHEKDGMSAIHHNSGFVSVFGKHTEMSTMWVKKNKHWQEMNKRGFKLYTK